MPIFKTISNEIRSYIEDNVEIFDNYNFSQYKLIRRIVYYQNQVYPNGKLDKQGNYKYWFDIISPRIDSEIKNVDFDSKDIKVYSDGKNDAARVLIANGFLMQWLKNTGQGEKINEAVEMGTSWGNVVWKKVNGDYEICDLRNFYVINQTAKSLKDSPVIERHLMTQSELREKQGIWKNVDEVIDKCGNKMFSVTGISNSKDTENPYYEIFERNGEVSEKDLFEVNGKSGGSEKKYVLAKVIVAGISKSNSADKTFQYILYADKISEMPYKEYHRGRYQGRWFRVGMYELLMDIQTRANEIGNQISLGLGWASKTIFRSSDKVIAQNVLDDLTNGDIVKSTDLQQVEMRMQGLDQLIADWNRLMDLADKLANSYEVVTGESLPSGTPFRMGAMLNQNANKLFDFIREKMTLAFQDLIENYVLPYMLSDIKTEDVIRITGDDEWLRRYWEVLINSWYVQNLIALGPHTQEEGQALKDFKMEELQKNKEAVIKLEKSYWEEFKPRCQIDITGERVSLVAELETLANFIGLESDPVRRTALIEIAMKKKGIDISSLPKTDINQQLAVAGRGNPMSSPATPTTMQQMPSKATK
jgi:hypothetical protein